MTNSSAGDPEKPTDKPGPDDGNEPTKQDKHDRIEACFRELLKLYAKSDGEQSTINNAVADVLSATLGSVPSFAVGESMIAASQAQGQMLTNAVANQQKTNLVGLTATTECVRQLLHLHPRHHYKVYEEYGEDEAE